MTLSYKKKKKKEKTPKSKRKQKQTKKYRSLVSAYQFNTRAMLARLINYFMIIQLSFMSTESSSSSSSSPSRTRVPALYVFGDSLVENGNNNHLLTVAKADYFPYGVDFSKGPTGRFTNGRTIADFTCKSPLSVN